MAGDSLRLSSRNPSEARLLEALTAVKLDLESNKAGNVDESLLSDLVSQLESDDHSICSRLDSKVYCSLILTVLQINGSQKSERVFYLLGAALYYDSLSPVKEHSVKKKKDAIGKDYLGVLLEFFMDGSNSSGMRQWVGTLALQLFQNCDSNVRNFELGPERQRRGLGNFVLKEPNEILRIICGQLITALLTAGVLPEHLWPADTDTRLYTTFPTVALGSRGWNQQFQNYMDNIYEMAEQPDSPGQLYFTQNVSLTPQYNFGPDDHNVMIVIDDEKMIIWTGVVADTQNFNHCLNIPLRMISKMLIKARSDSQLNWVLNVYLSLKKIDEECYLDCMKTSIDQICMVLQQSVLESMRDDLHQICPKLEINYDKESAGDQDDLKDAQHTSQTSEALQFHGNAISVLRNHLGSATNEKLFEVESGRNNKLVPKNSLKSTAGLERLERLERLETDSPGLTKGHNFMNAKEPKKLNETAAIRKRVLPLKPKAKPPLRQPQNSTGDCPQGQPRDEMSPIPNARAPRGLLYEEIENNSPKFELQFPSTNVLTGRGMAITSKGNFENSVEMQANNATHEGSNKEISSQLPSINGEIKRLPLQFHEASKSQDPTKGARDKQRRATITGAEAMAVRMMAPRQFPKQKINNLNNDDENCYDIPPDETQTNPAQTSENNTAKNTKSRFSSTNRRKPIVKKYTTQAAKSLKATQNKRQSAPAALGQVNTRRTGLRQAAAAARKKLAEADSNDDEYEFNEKFEAESLKPVQKSSKNLDSGSTQEPKRTPFNLNIPGRDQHTIEQEGGKQEHRGSLASPEDNFALGLSDDLYGASPIRPGAEAASGENPYKYPFDDLYDATPNKLTMSLVQGGNQLQENPSQASLPAQNGQILGRMAAKMTSLLGDLDKPYEIENLSKQQEKERRNHQPKKISNVSTEKCLVNGYFSRKTPLVAFDKKGARNQGLPGLVPASKFAKAYLENSTHTNAEQAEDRKRKWETANDGGNNTPPRKRQSLSPNSNQTPIADNHEYFLSSPRYSLESDSHARNSCEHGNSPDLPRVSKYCSQGSRVDKNGSPRATRSSQIDRISKIKRKLLDKDDPEEFCTPKLTYSNPLYTTISQDIFGPKIRLGSLPKARPSSSLEATESRYIPHKKTRNGHYEVLGTNEIIELEKPLLDPFIDKAASHPTGDFNDRLLAGSSSAIVGSKRVMKGTHHDGQSRLDTKAKLLHANLGQTEGSKTMATTRVSKRMTEVFMDEDEDTLIEPSDPSSYDKYSVPEMTTDTSYDSRSPLAEKSKAWNMAVRPHYENLSETIHQIADEVIIRLADEEDAIKLIAHQYKENGEKLLYQAAQKRSEEKAVVTSELGRKHQEMVALYTKAKGLADRTKHTLENSPLSAVSKEWKSQCDAVQEQINKGKMISESG